MATDTSLAKTGLAQSFSSMVQAYDQMEMPIRQYLLLVLLPALVFFVVSVAIVVVVELPQMISIPVPLLGLLAFVTAVVYPKLLVEQEKKQLENRLHLLITHMTVLATTNIDRMEVFRELAKEREYRALADEINRIVQLVDTWNQSLDDACRRRAREVPSPPLSDFLDRLAYTIGAGQGLDDFLLREQSVVIQNYVTIYEGALENLEIMKDLYLSMILSMTFGLVFAVVLPVLTGTDPTLTVAAVITLFIFVQIGFAYAIYTVVPFDPVWYLPDEIDARSEPKIRQSVLVGVGLSAAVVLLLTLYLFGLMPFGLDELLPPESIPVPLLAVFPLTPLLIPGIVIRSVEEEIKGRDDEFPSFIRALGAAESAKQSTTSAVLKDLRRKDFGPLTLDIDNLYKRLNMRIEPAKAWRYFAADTQSYLIQKFSEMYLIGRQMGGSPKQLGEIIAENMGEVLQLRERRAQSAITLIGLLYGITAAATFAFFIALEVVNILAGLSTDIMTAGEFDIGSVLSTDLYNIPLVQFLLIVIVLFNALLSSLMIRTVDGGHKVNAFVHFVVLAWISSVIAVFTRWLVGLFLNV